MIKALKCYGWIKNLLLGSRRREEADSLFPSHLRLLTSAATIP